MPDGLGRYTRSEMREIIRRYTDLVQSSSVSAAGAEADGSLVISPIASNEDLNFMLNAAVSTRFVDMALADETALADSEYIDIETYRVEYPLPVDLAILRALYWKDSGATHEIHPPADRVLMYLVDGESPSADANGVPTYRRRLDKIVLNEAPTADNSGGIMVDYVKWALPLLSDDQVLETQYARVMQEVVILDVAIDVIALKLRLDPSILVTLRDGRLDRLTALIRSSLSPPFMLFQPKAGIVRYNR